MCRGGGAGGLGPPTFGAIINKRYVYAHPPKNDIIPFRPTHFSVSSAAPVRYVCMLEVVFAILVGCEVKNLQNIQIFMNILYFKL